MTFETSHVKLSSVSAVMFMKALGGFFAIMNPFTALPLFLSLNDGATPHEKRRDALRIALYVTILCILFFVSGETMLKVFGIKLNDFRLAGGLVLLTIALGMLRGGGSATHEGSKREQAEQAEHAASIGDIAFYPMAFPMLVGPGTITTIIVLRTEAQGIVDNLAIAGALLIIIAAVAVVLYFSNEIGRLMSATLRTIMSRLMGMILAAIAVDMMSTAALGLFPGLN